jgi:hypothetical protein
LFIPLVAFVYAWFEDLELLQAALYLLVGLGKSLAILAFPDIGMT